MGREIENSLILSAKRKVLKALPSYEDLVREILFLALDYGAVTFSSGYSERIPKWKIGSLLSRAVGGVWDPCLGRCYREVAETYYETAIFTVSDPFELYRRIRRSEQMLGFFARKLSTEDYTLRVFNAVSDRQGITANACGHHNNFLQTRRLYDRIFHFSAKEYFASDRKNIQKLSPTAQDLISAWTVLLPLRGAGKIGADAGRKSVSFQISERADFICHLIGSGTHEDRPFLHNRDEPHADIMRFSRLHMINGEGYRFPWTAFFDIGLTAMILSALDDDAFRLKWVPKDPIASLLQISRDLNFAQKIPIVVRSTGAVDEKPVLILLREVLTELESYFKWAHLPSWCDKILGQAITTVDELIYGEFSKAERMIDWLIKKKFLEDVMESKFGLDPRQENSWFHFRVRTLELGHHRLDDDKVILAEAKHGEVIGWEEYSAPYGIPEQDGFWTQGEPKDTRSYLYWFLTNHPEWKERTKILDWSKIEIWNKEPKDAVVISVDDPRKFGKPHLLFLLQKGNFDFSTEADRGKFIEIIRNNAEGRNEAYVEETRKSQYGDLPLVSYSDIDSTKELELMVLSQRPQSVNSSPKDKDVGESQEEPPPASPGCVCCTHRIPHTHMIHTLPAQKNTNSVNTEPASDPSKTIVGEPDNLRRQSDEKLESDEDSTTRDNSQIDGPP